VAPAVRDGSLHRPSKGQLIGLRKADVDLPNRLLTVTRSYRRDTTKGGHADVIPIATELMPYLEDAIASSPSNLVFPAPDGSMTSEAVQLELVLRRALHKAGIVESWLHKCRRAGCRHVETASDDGLRRCPRCQMKLWPSGQVRPIRFHHLRHTTASLLLMRGADVAAVQRILRHSDPRLTTETYGHLVARLPALLRVVRKLNRSQSLNLVGARGFEPPASCSQNHHATVADGVNGLQATEMLRDSDGAPVQRSQGVAGNSKNLVTRLLPGSGGGASAGGGYQPGQEAGPAVSQADAPGTVHPTATNPTVADLIALRGGRDGLLEVGEVAAELAVCAATVYRLCERGELPHVRIINSIRVRPRDLAAFMAGPRSY